MKMLQIRKLLKQMSGAQSPSAMKMIIRRKSGPLARSLPIHKTINSWKVWVDAFDMDRFEEAYEMFTATAITGHGYGEYETTREEIFHKMTSYPSYSFTNADNNDLMGVLNIYPCPRTRSTQSLINAAMVHTHPKYRGKGVGAAMVKICQQPESNVGCVGFMGRTPLTSKNIIPLIKCGNRVPAIIPLCNKLQGIGLVDSIVTWQDYGFNKSQPEYFQSLIESHAVPPPEVREDVGVWWRSSDHHFEPTALSCQIPGACIRPTQGHEVWSVETMFRNSALDGQGFALDEFTEYGHFNKRLMAFTDTFVLEAEGRVIGGAMFGPSTLGRTHPPLLATCYLAIIPEYKHQGLGRQVLQYFAGLALQLQYRMLVVDCLMPQSDLLHILQTEGFTNCGSLPYSAYMKDIGLVDSMLFYKDLRL